MSEPSHLHAAKLAHVEKVSPCPAHGGLRRTAVLALASCMLLVAPPAARAAPEQTADGIPAGSIARHLPYNLDPRGIRKWLAEHGLTFGFILTSEGLANVSGGLKRGAVFEGKLEGYVNADLEKMLGWKGSSIYANVFQIHGTGGIDRDLVGGLDTISNIEALPTTRLSELWFEQRFFNDTMSVRVGQLAADSEFFIADLSQFFMNSDWPAITKHDLPSGGPSYPLSTPGIRFKVDPNKQLSFLVALFNGDPAGPGPEDPEIKNRYGLNFRVQDPPLLISELQYRYNQEKTATGLAGIVRFGSWYHFGRFDDQQLDALGLSLANPLSPRIASRLVGNAGIYGVIDQQLYRPTGGAADSGIGVFSRISASPSDRNLINFYLDGGIVFSGMLPGRPDDKFGATFIYSNISSGARGFDRDVARISGVQLPLRDFELSIALAYQALIVPGWTVQAEIHHIVHPGGHAADFAAAPPLSAIPDATVLALRSVVTY